VADESNRSLGNSEDSHILVNVLVWSGLEQILLNCGEGGVLVELVNILSHHNPSVFGSLFSIQVSASCDNNQVGLSDFVEEIREVNSTLGSVVDLVIGEVGFSLWVEEQISFLRVVDDWCCANAATPCAAEGEKGGSGGLGFSLVSLPSIGYLHLARTKVPGQTFLIVFFWGEEHLVVVVVELSGVNGLQNCEVCFGKAASPAVTIGGSSSGLSESYA
jgi:hypothetical protein